MSIVNYHPFFYNTLKKAINLFNKLNMNVPQSAKKHEAGINLSILGLCTVAFLGMTLRTKMLFNIPFINYNYLSDAHAHFAFNGWVTLGLIVLMIRHILPAEFQKKAIYWWLTGSIFFFSWVLLFTYAAEGNGHFSTIFSTLLIFATYIFTWVFIRDAFKAKVNKIVLLLSVGALLSLVLSSGGAFMIAYLFSVQSLNGILYRDALFTYLHFQYNGFFSLAALALLFQYFIPFLDSKGIRVLKWFSILLTCSVLPSLFLSYLWQDPRPLFWVVAVIGSILVFLSFLWFVMSIGVMRKSFHNLSPIVKYLFSVAILAFAVKLFLQGFLIIPVVGDQVFGNRPIIMAFLHLVFLGFVTHFLLGYYSNSGILNVRSIFTRFALILFSTAVICNEAILAMQGLSFTLGYSFCLWVLWVIGIFLFIGALFIGISRMITARTNSI